MRPRNLADPDYEPTDEDLAELMKQAFADVASERAAVERELRERIARARVDAVRALRATVK